MSPHRSKWSDPRGLVAVIAATSGGIGVLMLVMAAGISAWQHDGELSPEYSAILSSTFGVLIGAVAGYIGGMSDATTQPGAGGTPPPPAPLDPTGGSPRSPGGYGVAGVDRSPAAPPRGETFRARRLTAGTAPPLDADDSPTDVLVPASTLLARLAGDDAGTAEAADDDDTAEAADDDDGERGRAA